MASTTEPASSRASARYETERGPAIFRHREHLERLQKSAELYYLDAALLARGAARGDPRADPAATASHSCYIRPIAFRGYGEMGLYAPTRPST